MPALSGKRSLSGEGKSVRFRRHFYKRETPVELGGMVEWWIWGFFKLNELLVIYFD
jgi:hypothetical protein